MQIENILSKLAWGERETKFRSAKWSAAMVVATFAALLIFGTSLSYTGQSPVRLPVGLDWTHWTKDECDAMWIHSPWGISQEYWAEPRSAYSVWSQLPTGRRSVELRSALPVRQAILREYQMKKNYDTMNPQQKLAFDKKYPPDMTEHDSDPILLYIQQDDEDVDSAIGDMNFAPHPATQVALKLLDGSLVMPTKTEAFQNDQNKNRTQYSFPRVINGKPILTVHDEYLTFVFGQALQGGRRIRPLQDPKKFRVASDWMDPYEISFRVADLIYNGKLEY